MLSSPKSIKLNIFAEQAAHCHCVLICGLPHEAHTDRLHCGVVEYFLNLVLNIHPILPLW